MAKIIHDMGALDLAGYMVSSVQLLWWYSERAKQYVLEFSCIGDEDEERWEPTLLSPIGVGFIPPEYDRKRHCFLKSYSECEGMLEALVDAGAVRETGIHTLSGFARLPLVELLFVPEGVK